MPAITTSSSITWTKTHGFSWRTRRELDRHFPSLRPGHSRIPCCHTRPAWSSGNYIAISDCRHVTTQNVWFISTADDAARASRVVGVLDKVIGLRPATTRSCSSVKRATSRSWNEAWSVVSSLCWIQGFLFCYQLRIFWKIRTTSGENFQSQFVKASFSLGKMLLRHCFLLSG